MCGLEAGGGEGEAGGQEPGGQQVPRPPCNQPRLLLMEGVVNGSETRDSDTLTHNYANDPSVFTITKKAPIRAFSG